jgi:hypothetical protein
MVSLTSSRCDFIPTLTQPLHYCQTRMRWYRQHSVAVSKMI